MKQHGRELLRAILLVLALCGTHAKSAEDEVEFRVDTPAVVAIKKSIAERFLQLSIYFEAGVIGLTQDGLIAQRDAARISQEHRAALEVLITEDNKDRSTMYREIARANGRPDWENSLRTVFAQRWISRAPAGWYYRDGDGNWIRKIPPAA